MSHALTSAIIGKGSDALDEEHGMDRKQARDWHIRASPPVKLTSMSGQERSS